MSPLGGARPGTIGGFSLPALVGTPTAVNQGSTASPGPAVALPAGVADGDLLIYLLNGLGNRTWGPPAGWTEIVDVFISPAGQTLHHVIGWKTAAAEPGTVTFSWTGGNDSYRGVVMALRGSNLGVDAQGTDSHSSVADPSTTVNAPSLTATRPGALITMHTKAAGAGGNLTPAAGMTEILDNDIAGQAGILIAYKTLTVPGATGVQGATGFSASSLARQGSSVVVGAS